MNQFAVKSRRVDLQYIIRDGNSDDDTVSRIEGHARSKGGEAIELISTSDRGMYDALGTGLSQADGDIVAYLNAGDYYSPACFDTVLDVFERKESVQWLTGMRVLYAPKGPIYDIRLPGPFRKRLMERGYYGFRGRLGHLQQESTFWTSDLLAALDFDVLREYRLAGDFYMWMQFIKRSAPTVVYSHLGGFRLHGDHVSEDRDAYRAEMAPLLKQPRVGDSLVAAWDLAVQQLPVRVRRHVGGQKLVTWRTESGEWE